MDGAHLDVFFIFIIRFNETLMKDVICDTRRHHRLTKGASAEFYGRRLMDDVVDVVDVALDRGGAPGNAMAPRNVRRVDCADPNR